MKAFKDHENTRIKSTEIILERERRAFGYLSVANSCEHII